MTLSITSCKVGNIYGTYFTEIKGVSNLRARVDLLQKIIYEKLKEKWIRVGVQHAEFVTQGVLEKRIELCYLKLAPLKNAKVDLKRIVNYVANRAHLYADQIIAEHSEVHAVRLFGETANDGSIGNKFNFILIGNILDGLSVHRIIHQLVEILQKLVVFAHLLLVGVVSNVRIKICTWRTIDAEMNLDELQTTVEVKSQVWA